MKPIWQILQPNQLGTTLDDVKSALGGFTTKMAQDLQRILSNGATVKDNLAMTYIEFDAIHGTETRVANPFRSVPQAFIPISAFSLTGGTNGVGARNTGVQIGISGQPILNTSRTDGYLGITVNYAPPPGSIGVNRVAVFPTVNGVTAPVSWDNTDYIGPGGISTSGTRVSFASAGRVLLTGMVLFDTAAGGYRQFFFQKNGASAPSLFGSAIVPGGSFGGALTSEEITVAAGDYVELYVFQNSGGALSLLNGVSRPKMQARYIAPDPSTTAHVRGILVEA